MSRKPKNVKRSVIEVAIAKHVVAALQQLALPENGLHLRRVFRSLLGVGLDLMAAGADGVAPADIVAHEIDRVLLRKGVKKPKAVPHVAPGTLGSCVLKKGQA